MPATISVFIEPLTPREQEVMDHLALGRSNDEIAVSLIVTTKTVKSHLATIFEKLAVTSRTEAVVTAQALGLVGHPEQLSATAQVLLAVLQLDPDALKQLIERGYVALDGSLLPVRAYRPE